MAGAGPSAVDVLKLVPPALRSRERLWVVGGAVRDVLLGRAVREVDLVVEGDALALAREVGEVVAVHERFGTATARVGGVVVDLASARRERYARPGALPDVQLGVGIEEDLRRRDFTVNAMAVRVADGAFVAVESARRDLDARVLRVLHEGSFVDDPTRLLRVARYAGRLGFAASGETARLARAAVAGGALGTVTGARLGNELVLLLDEPQPEAVLALAAHGVGAALLGAPFAVDEGAVTRAVALCRTDGRRGVAALGAALAGRWAELASDSEGDPAHEGASCEGRARWAELASDSEGDPAQGGGRRKEHGRWADLISDTQGDPPHRDTSGEEQTRWVDAATHSVVNPAHGSGGAEDSARRADPATDSVVEAAHRLDARLRALALPARERDLLVSAAREAPALGVWLAAPRRPSELWDRLRRVPAETVAVAGALVPGATPAAGLWLDDLRHVRADVSGRDLLERGVAGPAVGRGLEAALRARLDGDAPDPGTQLAVALAAAAEDG